MINFCLDKKCMKMGMGKDYLEALMIIFGN